jgi:hypothetical protein
MKNHPELFTNCSHRTKNPIPHVETGFLVVMDGIEPPTQGFSVLCSTN